MEYKLVTFLAALYLKHGANNNNKDYNLFHLIWLSDLRQRE